MEIKLHLLLRDLLMVFSIYTIFKLFLLVLLYFKKTGSLIYEPVLVYLIIYVVKNK